jgi:hypothetical protein
MSIDCTSSSYRDKTSHNKQIYTLKKNLLKFENERILIIFTPELFILAWFSVRLPLFSYDLKTIFVFWRQICYIF